VSQTIWFGNRPEKPTAPAWLAVCCSSTRSARGRFDTAYSAPHASRNS